MPQIITCDDDAQCSLEQCIDEIADIGFDPASKETLAQTALWLRRLNNNRTFLGDILIEQLKSRAKHRALDSGYGPQAIVLSSRRGDVFLRANIWPSERDQCFAASGAQTFVYGVPHDHNFSFLTAGYFGPGYRSDYYTYDYEKTVGYAGEKPELKFVERSALSEGKMMLYRAHTDIHSQIPPESMSVSLNVMHIDPVQGWFDQYGFDLGEGAISRVLSPNSTEAFLRAAVATRCVDALDLAEQFGQHHPSDRMRLASYEARAKLIADAQGRDALWREAELSGNAMLAAVAKTERSKLAVV